MVITVQRSQSPLILYFLHCQKEDVDVRVIENYFSGFSSKTLDDIVDVDKICQSAGYPGKSMMASLRPALFTAHRYQIEY